MAEKITLFSDVRVDSISSPKMWWTIQYEYKRDGTDMLYNFHWKVYLTKTGTAYFDYMMHLKFYVNGSLAKTVMVKDETNLYYDWTCEGETGWIRVSNKLSGSTPFYAVLTAYRSQTVKATSSTYQLAVSGAASVLGDIGYFDVESEIPISITKYDNAFTDTLIIFLNDTPIKSVSGITNGAKVSFTKDELNTIYSLMSTVKSATFTFTLATNNGNTQIGISDSYAIGSILNANPIFDDGCFTYQDTNPSTFNITRNQMLIVQNKSVLEVMYVNANAQKGAEMSKYIFELNGVTKEGGVDCNSIEFGTINSAQNLTLTATAIDTRGNRTTATQEVRVLAWQEPSAVVELSRKNNYEDETHLKVKATISSVNNLNGVAIIYQCRELDGQYSDIIPIDNNTETVITCDKNKAYMFYVRVWDMFDGVFEKEYLLPKGKFPLFIDTGKNAVGINEFPEGDEALRVGGGVARFDEGIVLLSATKKFLISVTDSGQLNITEI